MKTAKEYEQTWGSGFGDDYQTRNSITKEERLLLWHKLLENVFISSALEVGCSRGHNLYCVKEQCSCDIVGVEINEKAIQERFVNNIVKGSAYELPFIDGQFDLVYTAGVLIHLSDTLKAMQEIYRTSNKYILSIEYFDDKEREINYRNDVYCEARNFNKLWLENFSNLKVVKTGKMGDFGIHTRGDDFSTACGYILLEKVK